MFRYVCLLGCCSTRAITAERYRLHAKYWKGDIWGAEKNLYNEVQRSNASLSCPSTCALQKVYVKNAVNTVRETAKSPVSLPVLPCSRGLMPGHGAFSIKLKGDLCTGRRHYKGPKFLSLSLAESPNIGFSFELTRVAGNTPTSRELR